jgi:hypothetical protein
VSDSHHLMVVTNETQTPPTHLSDAAPTIPRIVVPRRSTRTRQSLVVHYPTCSQQCLAEIDPEKSASIERWRRSVSMFMRPESFIERLGGQSSQISATQMLNTIFTMTMQFVTIPSQASESLDEPICRHCGVIIPASRQVSTSREFSEKVTSGSRNTQSSTRGDPHTQ